MHGPVALLLGCVSQKRSEPAPAKELAVPSTCRGDEVRAWVPMDVSQATMYAEPVTH